MVPTCQHYVCSSLGEKDGLGRLEKGRDEGAKDGKGGETQGASSSPVTTAHKEHIHVLHNLQPYPEG